MSGVKRFIHYAPFIQPVSEEEAKKHHQTAVFVLASDYEAERVRADHLAARLAEWVGENDTLRAEVERYKAMSDNYCALGMDSQVEIAKLRAEVEALRGERDAAAEIANANADQALRLSAEVQVLRGEHGVKS